MNLNFYEDRLVEIYEESCEKDYTTIGNTVKLEGNEASKTEYSFPLLRILVWLT